MAPRLSHKKTRTGCMRCKARKVKCDEEKPKCGACSRHNVHCEYPISPYGDPHIPSPHVADDVQASHNLETRLLYEWMAYTCYTISTIWEFWKYQIPPLAFQHRHVFDSVLAISALHASRAGVRYWYSTEGKMLTKENGEMSTIRPPGSDAATIKGWNHETVPGKGLLANIPPEDLLLPEKPDPDGNMLQSSRRYFARALEGHQMHLANLNLTNYRSCYLSSVLISCYSLFTLSEGFDDGSLMLDPMRWVKLSRGTFLIIKQWQAEVGPRWFVEAGGMYGPPDLSDNGELFHPDHQEPFKHLLSAVQGDEVSDGNREAYEHTLSYIGLLYKGIVQNTDTGAATGRRIIAMPSRVPPRFIDLVEANEPRALAMLAHAFASIKLAEDKYPWFRGIAQRQVPIICNALPQSWNVMVQWPLEMVNGSEPSQRP